MAEMYNTTMLERELLCIMLKDKMTLNKVCAAIREDWMSTPARVFILQRIKESFREYRTLIKKDTLHYDVEKSLDADMEASKIKAFKDEVDIVCATEPTQKVGFLIDKLSEAKLADGVKSIVEQSFLSLEKGDVDKAVAMIKSGSLALQPLKKSSQITALHGNADGWYAEVMNRKNFPEKYAGLPTGMVRFDLLTGGLFKAELTLIFGLAGKGKSTVLKNICAKVRKNGGNVLHVTNEENAFQVQTKYHSLETKVEYQKFKRGLVSDEEMEGWQEFNRLQRAGYGDIYVMEIPQGTDSTQIEAAYFDLKQNGTKIDLICVDYMDLMSSVGKAFSEWDEQGKVTKDLKQIAINCDVPVITCTQGGIQIEKMEKKDNPFVTASDMFGTKQKAHSANTIIGLVNKTSTVSVDERDPNEQNLHKIILCVCKNRDGPNFSFRQLMQPEIGMMLEDDSVDVAADNIEAAATALANDVQQFETQTKIIGRSEYNSNAAEMKSLTGKITDLIAGKGKKFDLKNWSQKK